MYCFSSEIVHGDVPIRGKVMVWWVWVLMSDLKLLWSLSCMSAINWEVLDRTGLESCSGQWSGSASTSGVFDHAFPLTVGCPRGDNRLNFNLPLVRHAVK